MTTQAVLGLPFIAQQQSTPEITHNEAVVMLAALLYGVTDRGINAPPGAPATGDSYIIGTVPTGAWAGRANAIAVWDTTQWRFIPGDASDGSIITMGAAQEGMSVWVKDENTRYTWTGAAWSVALGILAANVTYVPHDDIASTDVQAAINEVADKRVKLNHSTGQVMTGYLVNPVLRAGELLPSDSLTTPFASRKSGSAPGSVTFQCEAGNMFMSIQRYGNDANPAVARMFKSRGTIASVVGVNQNDVAFRFDGTVNTLTPGDANNNTLSIGRNDMIVRAATPSTTDLESEWTVSVVPAASASLTSIIAARHSSGVRMTSAFSGLVVGTSATQQGSGTINAQAGFYHNGIRVDSQQAVATDANFTLTKFTSPQRTRHTGTLTADRTVTLSTTNAVAGDTFRVIRTGGGAFNLSIGGLKNLVTDTWCEVTYDGAAWYLSAYGAL